MNILEITTSSDLDDNEDIWITPPHFTKSNPLHVQLLELEHSFRCRICQDFLRSPVSIIPCSHTYCSECIRHHFKTGLKSMKRIATCPECRLVVDTKGAIEFSKCLVPNRSIEIASMKFRQLRTSLHTALSMSSPGITTSPSVNSSSQTCNSKKTNNSMRDDEKNVCNDINSNPSPENHVDDNYLIEPVGEESKLERSIRTRKRFCVPSEDFPSTTLGIYQDNVSSSKKSELLLELQQQQQSPVRIKRKSIFYKSLKKKQLHELCAEEGLPTHGTEHDLIHRHEEFVTLYNAECDSFHNPKSHQEIVSEIIKREKERAMAQMYVTKSYNNEAATDCMERLKESRKKMGEMDNGREMKNECISLTSGNPSFDRKLQINFSKLISQGKERMNASKVACSSNSSSDKLVPVDSRVDEEQKLYIIGRLPLTEKESREIKHENENKLSSPSSSYDNSNNSTSTEKSSSESFHNPNLHQEHIFEIKRREKERARSSAQLYLKKSSCVKEIEKDSLEQSKKNQKTVGKMEKEHENRNGCISLTCSGNSARIDKEQEQNIVGQATFHDCATTKENMEIQDEDETKTASSIAPSSRYFNNNGGRSSSESIRVSHSGVSRERTSVRAAGAIDFHVQELKTNTSSGLSSNDSCSSRSDRNQKTLLSIVNTTRVMRDAASRKDNSPHGSCTTGNGSTPNNNNSRHNRFDKLVETASSNDSTSISCSSNNNGAATVIGPWECPVCTYFNEKNKSSRAICEICDNPRPKRKYSPSSMIYKVDC